MLDYFNLLLNHRKIEERLQTYNLHASLCRLVHSIQGTAMTQTTTKKTPTHVLAGCGSFMAGVCTIAAEMGHRVTAYDKLFQSPMKDQLIKAGIQLHQGYENININPEDEVIIGNAVSRGLPTLERLLSQNHHCHSGAGWLSQKVLSTRKVVAIAGTHGKTTTSALTAWTLDHLGQDPGFLIGGITQNHQTSARLGSKPWFVIEADEYDTACFDKRAKFFHYPATCLILNNLEFDHADIYRDLDAIKLTIKHYLQTLKPGTVVVYPDHCPHLKALATAATWCRSIPTHHANPNQPWHIQALTDDWSQFSIIDAEGLTHHIHWPLIGIYNAQNALHVMTALHALGFKTTAIAEAFKSFQGVARRLTPIPNPGQQLIFDDYAHHPTAVNLVLNTLKKRYPNRRLICYLQLSNHTQREGLMWQDLIQATSSCDVIFIKTLHGNFPYQTFADQHSRPVVILKDPLSESPDLIIDHIEENDIIATLSSRCCKDFHHIIQSIGSSEGMTTL